jgi:two-component system osmolarity sensor histidine kinase EnvZ
MPASRDCNCVRMAAAYRSTSHSFPFARRLANDLAERLGEPVLLRHGGPGQRSGLWIGFMAGSERWWLLLPPPRFEPQALPSDLWLFLAMTLAAVLLIAGLFVRGIVGPLARLGDAVAATGDGAGTHGDAGRSARGAATGRAPQHDAWPVGQRSGRAARDARRSDARPAGTADPLASASGAARKRCRAVPAWCVTLTTWSASSANAWLSCAAKTPMLRQAPLAIAALLRESVARQRELGRAVELTVSDAAAQCRVAITAGNLQRLLDNLIDNALQHGAPPVEVQLSTGQ